MTEQTIGKTFLIKKAWVDEGSQDTHIEGWISTPALDKERHITQPEAFLPVMDTYFSNYAPISYHHGTDVLPAGHLQKAAVIRDGKILKESSHPTDPSEFKYFDGSGSGVYAHGVINDTFASSAIQKGNVGCFSFIAHASGVQHDDGTTVWDTLSDWMESTVSPYPINTQATFRIAKAHGYTPPLEKDTPLMTEEEMQRISAMIAKAMAPVASPPATPPPTVPPVATPSAGLTADELATSLAALKTDILTHVESVIVAKLTKAATDRGIGVGTKAILPDPTEGLDAVDAVIKKAGTMSAADFLRDSIDPVTGSYKHTFTVTEFTQEEQDAANHMTWQAFVTGMVEEDPI